MTAFSCMCFHTLVECWGYHQIIVVTVVLLPIKLMALLVSDQTTLKILATPLYPSAETGQRQDSPAQHSCGLPSLTSLPRIRLQEEIPRAAMDQPEE